MSIRRRLSPAMVALLKPESPTLLQLAIRCPKCGNPPSFRIVDTERARYAPDAAERIVGTQRCGWVTAGGRVCTEVYLVPARAFQEAS